MPRTKHHTPAKIILGLALWLAPQSFAQSQNHLDSSDVAQLKAHQVVSKIWRNRQRNDGAIDAFAAVHIKAPPQDIWAVMTSCEKSLEVVTNMKSCDILETSDQGWDIREQKFRAPFPFKSFRTVFRADYIANKQIIIQRTGGDMKVQDAVWRIVPLENGVSRVTYRAAVQPKIPVPRFLLRRAVSQDTPEILRNLRAVVEANHDGYSRQVRLAPK